MSQFIEAKIIQNIPIAKDTFEMILKAEYIADNAEAGQFVNVYLDAPDMLLPRPFGVCQTDKNKGTFNIVYAIVGGGTKLLSAYPKGRTLKIMGPCGSGFKYNNEQNIIITGGGLGVPPLLMLAHSVKNAKINIYLGFKDKEHIILKDEFKRISANLYIATDNGSFGFKGNVIELMKNHKANSNILYACGPKPMLKAVCQYAKANNIKAQVSVEERMACGVGACLCCAVKTESKDGFYYKKVCYDGPVFWAAEVLWDD